MDTGGPASGRRCRFDRIGLRVGKECRRVRLPADVSLISLIRAIDTKGQKWGGPVDKVPSEIADSTDNAGHAVERQATPAATRCERTLREFSLLKRAKPPGWKGLRIMSAALATLAPTNFMLNEAEFDMIRKVVYEHCRISLSDDKIALVRARVSKQMRVGGFASVQEYLDHVLADHKSVAFTKFIDSISTNLTSFFRESQHFDYLSSTFLPALLAKKKQAGETRLVCWSAACSSGEEPYTLGMVLSEALAKQGGKWDVRMLATDISTAVLETASGGVYPESRMNGIPSNYRPKYFSPHGQDGSEPTFEVSPELRKMVRFRHLNLMDAWPFSGPFDFIFCRNVMIYFDKPTQQALVERFHNCLRPNGLLFTGHSESLTGVKHRFTHRRPSIYEKTGN
jgi:chemotaxis protein methyltransferase CheR